MRHFARAGRLAGPPKPPSALPSAGRHRTWRVSSQETQAQISPDGRWVAYTSDESGRFEVYARPLPPLERGQTTRISTDGGCQPRWRGDGRELFFLHHDQLMAAAVESGSSSLQPRAPKPLFKARVGRNSELTWDYVAANDGQRFLLKELVFEPGGSQMAVVLNWEKLLTP